MITGPSEAADRDASGAEPPFGRVALIGLGLVGGSIARALRSSTPAVGLTAWTPAGGGPAAAHAAGIVDRVAAGLEEAIGGADLIVLAAPPLAILEILDAHGRALGTAVAAGATLTDVASTKRSILAAADRAGLPFVGGHPMAGRESAGFGSADSELFRGRPWVIAPGRLAREADVRRVEALAEGVGARPIRLDAAAHDVAVAAISHLPLVASAALVEAVVGGDGWPAAQDLAASGWASMTRLARSDAEMGAGILATNRGEVAARLRAYRAAIESWIEVLERADGDGFGDAPAIRARLESARSALESGES